ncbi:MAG: hemerythrin domain-containing protein [Bacteroidales bacterium]|nr:hemerythrin domain-containing protein [Bacteroidales bacterium]MDG2082085.1 hemerythrin domain-containing protein [Bacteroidales bacterium]
MKLSEVILHDFNLVPIINRFGIQLGFGDSTIESVCKNKDIDLDFFMTILNSFHDPQYLDKEYLRSFPVELLINYLKETHKYYLSDKIPEIEALIDDMVEEARDDKEPCLLLQKFFKDYVYELKKHIDREETLVYPYVIKLSSSLKTASISDSVISMIKEYSITLYEEEHDDVEEKLNDLKNIIIKYLPTVKDQKNRFLLLKELSALENDLADHARIEDLILLPKVEILEKKALLG